MSACLVSIVLVCILAILPAWATPPFYTLTDLGPGRARAIAPDSDMVTGDISNVAQVFFPAPLSLGVSSLGYASHGETLVGELQSTGQRAFRWTAATGIEPLPLLPGHTHSVATALNAGGTIVGWGDVPPFDSAAGLRWQDGTVTALPRLASGGECFAIGINDVGDIVETCEAADSVFHAVLLPASGGLVDLHTPALGPGSFARGINNAQQVVGVGGAVSRGWLRNPGGQMLELPPLPGDLWSAAFGINDAGLVVGNSRLPNPIAAEFLHAAAVLWEQAAPFDLNAFVTNGSGWALVNAVGISQRGVILAVGLFNGQERNALLTPIPPHTTPPPLARNSRDLNGDGHADLVWQHTGSGQVAVWFLEDAHVIGSGIIAHVPDTRWQLIGMGDLDADGQVDLVWRHGTTGEVALWFLQGTTIAHTATLPADLTWALVAVGDVDSDGYADLVWRQVSTGHLAAWLMQGSRVRAGLSIGAAPDVQWRVVTVGDTDGDGHNEVVWRHEGAGQVAVWTLTNGIHTSGAVVASVDDPQWRLATVGDVDGDGHADLVWRHAGTGHVATWRLNGGSVVEAGVVEAGVVGQADNGWQLH